MSTTRLRTADLSRRSFLGLAAAGVAATGLRGRTGEPLPGQGTTSGSDLEEASVPELQKLMFLGLLSSAELTRFYLDRIAELNPTLHAVIQTNPDAMRIAARADGERRSGGWRGALHASPS